MQKIQVIKNILLRDFDPLAYLNIKLDPSLTRKQIASLKNNLNKEISDYLMLKIVGDLSDEEFDRLLKNHNGRSAYKLLAAHIPDLLEKIGKELENFKQEFLAT